jgi:hypothetical protein
LCGELHEQIVLVLPVVNRFAIAAFPSGKEIRVATPSHRPWLEAEHAPEAESPIADVAIGHPHQPINTAELILPSIASVVQKLREYGAVSHHVP